MEREEEPRRSLALTGCRRQLICSSYRHGTLLLALVGRKSFDAAALWQDGAADCGVAGAGGVGEVSSGSDRWRSGTLGSGHLMLRGEDLGIK